MLTIDWFLPGTNSGGPVRSYTNLFNLLRKQFEFYVVTRNIDYASDKEYKNIIPNRWIRLNDYINVYYISKDKLNKKHLKKIFDKIQIDIVLVNGIYSLYFSILPVFLLRNNIPLIISPRGMLNPQAFSVKGLRKKIFLIFARFIGFYQNINFHATNIDESNFIKNWIGSECNIRIAPNVPRRLYSDKNSPATLGKPVRFVSVSRISVEKGTLRLINILKEIDKPLLIDLYGAIYDEDYWNQCIKIITELPKNITINYMGSVESEEIPKVLEKYDFFVLLSEGENFGHSILEAMTAGLPVIISNSTPWKNLKEKKIGWNLDLNNNKEILKAFNYFLDMNNNEYKLWSDQAFNYAYKFSTNPAIIKKNVDLFNNKNK